MPTNILKTLWSDMNISDRNNLHFYVLWISIYDIYEENHSTGVCTVYTRDTIDWYSNLSSKELYRKLQFLQNPLIYSLSHIP